MTNRVTLTDSSASVGVFSFYVIMNFKPIRNTKNYFIHEDGYVFRVIFGKEEIIKINMIRGVPKVKIGHQRLNLILLMLEYFGNVSSADIKYSFKIINDRLPLKNITVKKLTGDEDHDAVLIFQFKCKEKASGQNSRVSFKSTITDIDVLNCLKRTNFKCSYCGKQLSSKRWHLDHVTPISVGGLNHPTNITPACKPCNMMKGSLVLEKFIFQAKKITEHFSFNYNND